MNGLASFKPFTAFQEGLLLGLAVFGLVVPNGVFVYYALMSPDVVIAALKNPIAAVFIAEAFLLLGLGAWLIRRARITFLGWKSFVVISLLGSLAFSVPLFLLLASRAAGRSAASAD